MKKLRTVISVIAMVVFGIVGFFIGATMNEAMCGAVLFSMIAGIACIVYTTHRQTHTESEHRKMYMPRRERNVKKNPQS